MIVSFEIHPGASLPERAIEKILQSSRTPVRAALARLEGEGLVLKHGRGYTVAPIDTVEVEQAFAFRLDVEIACIRMTIRKTSLQQMITTVPAAMGRTPANEPAKDYLRNATAFHLALAQMANNEFHLRALADVLNRLERVRSLETMSRADRQRAWQERQRILNFIRLRDEASAIAALTEHLARDRERLVRALENSRE